MVKMWVGAIIMLFFLALIPTAHGIIDGNSGKAQYPTEYFTYYSENSESGTMNFTNKIDLAVQGVWNDPTVLELAGGWNIDTGTCPSDSCKPFKTYFNWSEIPLGITNTYVCDERCEGMSCVDTCTTLKIINPPRINVSVSASDVSILAETNFAVTLENPTAGNITANTTAKITLNGNDVQTIDLGSVDLAPHSTKSLVQNWTPDKAGPYRIETNATFYSADYNNSEQFSNSSEIIVNLGTPTTSQIINIEDLPDTSSKDFTVTIKNPTGFNFTTNLTAKAVYDSNTNWTDTKSVQLDSFEEKNVTFTWKPAFMGPFDIKAEDDYNSTSTTIAVGKPDVDLSFNIEYGLIHDGLEGYFVNAYVRNPTGFKFTATDADFQLYLDDNGSRTVISDNDFNDLSMGAFATKSESVVIPYHEYSDRADIDVGQSTSSSAGSQGASLQNSDPNSILQGNSATVDAQLAPKGVLKAELKAYGKTLTKDISGNLFVLDVRGIAAPDKNNGLFEKQSAKEYVPMPEMTKSNVDNGMPSLKQGTTTIVVNNNSTVAVRPNALQMQNSFVSR
ncbi:MAG: hypothetical protein NTY99_02155 [DPANN group archaeon]|nr:hypothetical protein [DPANN group archaeon]